MRVNFVAHEEIFPPPVNKDAKINYEKKIIVRASYLYMFARQNKSERNNHFSHVRGDTVLAVTKRLLRAIRKNTNSCGHTEMAGQCVTTRAM